MTDSPDTATEPRLITQCLTAPPNVSATPWIDYWPGARNAPTDG